MTRYERLSLLLMTAAVLMLAVYMHSVSQSLAILASPPPVVIDACDRCDYVEGTDGWYEVHVPLHTH